MPPELPAFVAGSAALVAVPGPAVTLIVSHGLAQGRRAALTSTLGIEAGALVHVALATLGISALVASAPAALTVLRLVSAGVLLALGLRRLARPAPAAAPVRPHGGLFREAVLVNLLNPKLALVFAGFLPAFVDPGGDVTGQVLVLGVVFVLVATLIDGAWALASGSASGRLSAAGRRRFERLSGAVLVSLAVLLVVLPS